MTGRYDSGCRCRRVSQTAGCWKGLQQPFLYTGPLVPRLTQSCVEGVPEK